MMKLVFLIASMAVIALGLVRLRHEETLARRQLLELQREQRTALQRESWEQLKRLDQLFSPQEVQRHIADDASDSTSQPSLGNR